MRYRGTLTDFLYFFETLNTYLILIFSDLLLIIDGMANRADQDQTAPVGAV